MCEKDLSKFWDSQVPDKYKHFTESEFGEKAPNYFQQFQDNIFSHLPLQDFCRQDILIDWGVGGGLFSLFLAQYGNVIGVDIAKSSLQQAKNYLQSNEQVFYKLLLVDKLENARHLHDYAIKLLFSTSVIQHFISFEYWRKVASLWKELLPEYLAIQTRHGEKNEDNKEQYFLAERNYILGLRLTTEEVMSRFVHKYDVIYHHLVDDSYSMYEYFVFKRK